MKKYAQKGECSFRQDCITLHCVLLSCFYKQELLEPAMCTVLHRKLSSGYLRPLKVWMLRNWSQTDLKSIQNLQRSPISQTNTWDRTFLGARYILEALEIATVSLDVLNSSYWSVEAVHSAELIAITKSWHINTYFEFYKQI